MTWWAEKTAANVGFPEMVGEVLDRNCKSLLNSCAAG